jgi:hypothetical protein
MADEVPAPDSTPNDQVVEVETPSPPPNMVKLFSGQAFQPDEVGPLLRERKTSVIVLAGPANSGKSTLLTRIYHEMQQGPIDGMAFSGSQNLYELERRSFKSRIESGRTTPDTDRQSLPEGQTLVHLALSDHNGRHDLLIGDMAGEHFDDIADFAGEVQKQPALSRADVIAVVLDGEKCLGAAKWNVVARAQMTLRGLIESHMIRPGVIQLLITKWDIVDAAGDKAIEAAEKAEQELVAAIRGFGGHPSVFKTAARGSNPRVSPGFGIPDLLRSWLNPHPVIADLPQRAAGATRPFDLFN